MLLSGWLFSPTWNHFNRAADAHFLPAVVELFSAIQANYVSAPPGAFG
jgi:hypothetical protein